MAISDNPSIAWVDGDGTLRALKEGTTKIHCGEETYAVTVDDYNDGSDVVGQLKILARYNDSMQFYDGHVYLLFTSYRDGVSIKVFYTDSDRNKVVLSPSESTTVPENTTLHIIAPDPADSESLLSDITLNGVSVLETYDKEKGEYTAVMPDGNARLNIVYEKAVLWAIEAGVTKGVDETHFAPDDTVTRALVVTFLFRYENGNASGESGFVDVPVDAWYADAVSWAVANDITRGMDDTHFAPDDYCTRAQIVTFLYRDLGQVRSEELLQS